MKKFSVAFVALFMCFATSFAQLTIDGKRLAYDRLTNSYLLTVDRSELGGPYNKPIVMDDSVTMVMLNGKQVRTTTDLAYIDGQTTYSFYFRHNGLLTRSNLRFTCLPIVCLEGEFNDIYSEGSVQVTLPDAHETVDYHARIKWAGGTTLYDWIEKHNYHIKFVDENGEKMDVSFFGLRKDNHWRLDAGIVDMLRFRNKAAHSLWADFESKPYYIDKQPNARNYSRGEHVEVFLNGDYMGFFDMTEFLDRKQMKLKKYDEELSEFHGLMWKGKVATRQTLFRKDSVVVDTMEQWCGFDVMYPDIDDVNPTNFTLLNDAIRFVSRSNDATFASEVGDYFDLPVLADYYVFINMLFAIDNSSKNIIWGCYDSAIDKKLTLAVWDLEATVGQHWYDGNGFYRAPEIQPEVELLECRFTMLPYNRLFMRLMELPEFKNRVISRYRELRNTVLDPENLIARYRAIFDALESSGALERERERWTGSPDLARREINFYEEFEYLSDWIRRRVAYLDYHTFFVVTPGDVDNNGQVDIYDVTAFIDYLLTGMGASVNIDNADVNGDGDVGINDLTALINQIIGN